MQLETKAAIHPCSQSGVFWLFSKIISSLRAGEMFLQKVKKLWAHQKCR
jgi:hypothetical protein